MHPAALLDLTTEMVRQVLDAAHPAGQPADRVVSAFFRAHRSLGPRERHTLAETAYAVLRRRLRWQHQAQGGQGPLARRLALLAWQGDVQWLRRALSPEERAWTEAMANVDEAALPERLRHNLPAWVVDALAPRIVGDELLALADSLNRPAPLDLRVNVLKARRDEAREALAEEGVASGPTPHSPWGLRVEGKPSLERTRAFLQGQVEVQDEGSQLLALLTGAARGEMVVDFCAGAGGKTLALGAMMRNTGRLYAFDTSGHRLEALKPRLARSGLSNVHPVQIAHERDDRVRRLSGKIDRVLVDAPCSGLGTLRRNPDLKWRHSPETVKNLVVQQQAILASAARLLRAGGRLVYATCSLLAQENEGVIQAFEAEHGREFERLPAGPLLAAAQVPDACALESPPAVTGEGTGDENDSQAGCLRLWPHRHGTDGFFAVAWQRR